MFSLMITLLLMVWAGALLNLSQGLERVLQAYTGNEHLKECDESLEILFESSGPLGCLPPKGDHRGPGEMGACELIELLMDKSEIFELEMKEGEEEPCHFRRRSGPY